MRKALKRQLGMEKQAQNLRDSIDSGLRAQGVEVERREKEHQNALIARESKKKFTKDDAPQSKISQEKQARVEARLNAKQLDEAIDLERVNS